MRERELSTIEQSLDHSEQGAEPRPVADNLVAFTPSFQQADRVHAVLSGPDDCFATAIRSDDSMHVDPLTDCIYATSTSNSWGYLSNNMELTGRMRHVPCKKKSKGHAAFVLQLMFGR